MRPSSMNSIMHAHMWCTDDCATLLALTGAVSHSKEVSVERVPAQGGDSHLTCSVKLEPPEREQGPFVLLVVVCAILIVLEVCKEGGGRRRRRRRGKGRRGERRRGEGGRGEGGEGRGELSHIHIRFIMHAHTPPSP